MQLFIVAQSITQILDTYRATVLLMFVECDLPAALMRVVANNNDKHNTTRATVLLGELLDLGRRILPHCHARRLQAMPSLVSVITSGDASPEQRARAQLAASHLTKLHQFKEDYAGAMSRAAETLGVSARHIDVQSDT